MHLRDFGALFTFGKSIPSLLSILRDQGILLLKNTKSLYPKTLGTRTTLVCINFFIVKTLREGRLEQSVAQGLFW